MKTEWKQNEGLHLIRYDHRRSIITTENVTTVSLFRHENDTFMVRIENRIVFVTKNRDTPVNTFLIEKMVKKNSAHRVAQNTGCLKKCARFQT